MNALSILNNPDPAATFSFGVHAVRALTLDGSPWFVAADVCDALDLDDTSKACSRLDRDEKGTNTIRTPSGDQQMLVINESGLYSLILTSRKPEAKLFKKWVTREVLPAIRKTGSYSIQPQALPNFADPVAAARAWADAVEMANGATAALSLAAPKAQALDRIALSDGSLCLTDAAKTLQIQPRKFTQLLQEKGWLYRRPTGAGWLAYQDRIQQGVLEHKTTTGEKSDGSEWTGTQVRVTAKGLAKLAVVFGEVAA